MILVCCKGKHSSKNCSHYGVISSLHSSSQGICVCYGFAMRGLSGKALSAMHVEGGGVQPACDGIVFGECGNKLCAVIGAVNRQLV